jgi:hypothetical protein
MEFIETYLRDAWQNLMHNQHYSTVPMAIFIPVPLKFRHIKDS